MGLLQYDNRLYLPLWLSPVSLFQLMEIEHILCAVHLPVECSMLPRVSGVVVTVVVMHQAMDLIIHNTTVIPAFEQQRQPVWSVLAMPC